MENQLFQVKTDVWSENIENILKKTCESCKKYKIFNIQNSEKSMYTYNILMYTLIFLGPVSGILSSVNTSEPDKAKIIQVFITVFSFISGVLSAVLKFSKLEEKSSSYKSIANKYASLEGNITRQLSLDKTERVNAGEYLEWVSSSYETLFANTPNIIVSESSVYKDGHEQIVQAQEQVVQEQDNKHTIEIINEKMNFQDGKLKYELARLQKQEI
jgi:hypothetical protein